jgi:hypothetical protein
MVINVSEEHIASIFRVENESSTVPRNVELPKMVAVCAVLLRNVGIPMSD